MKTVKDNNWTRPSGPLNVWRIIDVKEKLNDDATIRVSIQDIPEDRYEEVLEHMCRYFQSDAVLHKFFRIKDDKHAEEANRMIWLHYLKQGLCIGAFELNSSDQLGELIAVNILYVATDENKKKIQGILRNSQSSGFQQLHKLMNDFSDKFDICGAYGVDKYLFEYGLSVKPSYRGRKIALYLLEAWSDIGRKYGISIGSAIFTAGASQLQGERAGFKTLHSLKYSEIVDGNGQCLYPNIEADSMTLTVKVL